MEMVSQPSLQFGSWKNSPKNTEERLGSSDQRTGLYPSNVSSMWSLLSEELRENGAGRGKAVCSPVVGLLSQLGAVLLPRTLPPRPRLPHLLAPAGSITISLDWLLPLCLRWNWKGCSSSGVLAGAGSQGIGWDAAEVMYRCPRPPQLFLLFLFSLAWCHSLEESGCHCRVVTVWIVPRLCYSATTQQGQRSTMTSRITFNTQPKNVERFIADFCDQISPWAAGLRLSLCLGCVSQRELTSPLSWISYSLSAPSAPCTPRCQITTLAGAGRSSTHLKLQQPLIRSSK